MLALRSHLILLYSATKTKIYYSTGMGDFNCILHIKLYVEHNIYIQHI